MSDFFISQWSSTDILIVLTFVGLFAFIGLVIVPDMIQTSETNNKQREAIPQMECKQLGEFILGDEIMYGVKELADRHWNVRCK